MFALRRAGPVFGLFSERQSSLRLGGFDSFRLQNPVLNRVFRHCGLVLSYSFYIGNTLKLDFLVSANIILL